MPLWTGEREFLDVGLRHYSAQRSQYACHAYQRLLGMHGIRCSMSRKGECLDNAVAERLLGSLTRERTAHRYYATRQDAKDDVIEYLKMCYNSRRKFSYLGYVSPDEYEAFALGA